MKLTLREEALILTTISGVIHHLQKNDKLNFQIGALILGWLRASEIDRDPDWLIMAKSQINRLEAFIPEVPEKETKKLILLKGE